MARGLTCLESLVFDIVPLLLHVVGDIDLGYEHFHTTGNLQFLIGLLLADLRHFLLGTAVDLLLLQNVVALSFLEEVFLLDIKSFHSDRVSLLR